MIKSLLLNLGVLYRIVNLGESVLLSIKIVIYTEKLVSIKKLDESCDLNRVSVGKRTLRSHQHLAHQEDYCSPIQSPSRYDIAYRS
jgi:hypothetical protein